MRMGGGLKRKVIFKLFHINEIFDEVERGKRLIKERQIKGNIPYASSSAMNNGIDAFIGNKENVREFENCLSLANSGSVGSCFYEPFKFIASDHVTHLKNKKLNQFHYLFLATMLNRLKEKYNFNREINDDRIKREFIMLPVDSNQKPNYKYMEILCKKILSNKYNDAIEFFNIK